MLVPRVICVLDVDVRAAVDETRVLVGEPFPLAGAQTVVFLLEPGTVGTNAVAKPGVFSLTANPAAPAASSSTFSFTAIGTTPTRFVADVSGFTSSQLAQAFVAVNLSMGTTEARWRGRVTVILYAKGLHVGEADIAIPPVLYAGNPTYAVVGRVPAAGLTHLRAGLYGTGFNDAADMVAWDLYVRGVTDTGALGGFVSADGGSPNAFGANRNVNVCSGNTSVSSGLPTPTDKGWVDVAIGLTPGTGATGIPTGNLHVRVDAIYSGTTDPVPRVIGVFDIPTTGTTSTAAETLFGPVFPIPGGQDIALLVEDGAPTNDAQVCPAVARFAATGAAPTIAVVDTTYTQTAKNYVYDIASFDDDYLAQAGMSFKTASGGNDGTWDGTLTVVLYASQLRVGELVIEVPTDLDADPSFYVVGRIPGYGLAKLRAALTGTGFTADAIEWELYVRGANDTNAPGAWFKAFVDTPPPAPTPIASANPKVCSGDVTVNGLTVNDHAWIDVAIGLNWDGTNTRGGTLRVAIGAIYS